MDKAYAIVSALLSPFMPLWLWLRRLKGKEDKSRLSERYGVATVARPSGSLVWIHAASVGEATSVLPLIHHLRTRFPHLRILLTTGTLTSAALMKLRLPKDAIHQYVPVDTPEATSQFMRYWRPDFAFFVESEFWPNLIREADGWQCFMGVINGRMSERSFLFWKKHPRLMSNMISCFNILFAQSEADADRFRAFGARNVSSVGNLKYDAEMLPCDEGKLLAFKKEIGSRPVWLAASTHPGEEAIVLNVHKLLSATRPNLLTIIVPRHPHRGRDIAAAIDKRLKVGLRSQNDAITQDTAIYLGDTMGELGLFYRLSELVFMGGSLVKHGGQNPLEPARLACAIVTGPHTHNFSDMYREMEHIKACARVKGAHELAAQIDLLFNRPDLAQALQAAAKKWVGSKAGATERLLDAINPIFGVAT